MRVSGVEAELDARGMGYQRGNVAHARRWGVAKARRHGDGACLL